MLRPGFIIAQNAPWHGDVDFQQTVKEMTAKTTASGRYHLAGARML
jgi:hypothetical protein